MGGAAASGMRVLFCVSGGHRVLDSISFSDSGVVMTTSKNNIKNAAQPTTAILMTSPRDDKDDVIDAKLDSFVDDIDGRCIFVLALCQPTS